MLRVEHAKGLSTCQALPAKPDRNSLLREMRTAQARAAHRRQLPGLWRKGSKALRADMPLSLNRSERARHCAHALRPARQAYGSAEAPLAGVGERNHSIARASVAHPKTTPRKGYQKDKTYDQRKVGFHYENRRLQRSRHAPLAPGLRALFPRGPRRVPGLLADCPIRDPAHPR